MDDIFFVKNIEKKLEHLQEEHKTILQVVYKNAIEQECVNDQYAFAPNICQCMSFSEIKKDASLDGQIVIACLRDLESLGFLDNIRMNPNKEYSYAITWLGLKYMELNSNNNM